MATLDRHRPGLRLDPKLIGAGLAATAAVVAGSLLTGGVEQVGDMSRAVPATPRRTSVGLVTGMPMYDSAITGVILAAAPTADVKPYDSCQMALDDTAGRDGYVVAIVPNSSHDGIAKSLNETKTSPAPQCAKALKDKFPHAKICALSNDPLLRRGLKKDEPIYSTSNKDLKRYTDAGSVFDCYIGGLTFQDDIRRIFGQGVSFENQTNNKLPVSKAHNRPGRNS